MKIPSVNQSSALVSASKETEIKDTAPVGITAATIVRWTGLLFIILPLVGFAVAAYTSYNPAVTISYAAVPAVSGEGHAFFLPSIFRGCLVLLLSGIGIGLLIASFLIGILLFLLSLFLEFNGK